MDQPRLYHLRLAGLAIQPLPGGETLLSGSLPDQAALHGLLACLCDLVGIEIIFLDSQPADPPPMDTAPPRS